MILRLERDFFINVVLSEFGVQLSIKK